MKSIREYIDIVQGKKQVNEWDGAPDIDVDRINKQMAADIQDRKAQNAKSDSEVTAGKQRAMQNPEYVAAVKRYKEIEMLTATGNDAELKAKYPEVYAEYQDGANIDDLDLYPNWKDYV